jgi:hypothetical protein
VLLRYEVRISAFDSTCLRRATFQVAMEQVENKNRKPVIAADLWQIDSASGHDYSPACKLSGLRPRRAQLAIWPRRRVGRI